MMKPAVFASFAIAMAMTAGSAVAAAGVSDEVRSVCSTLNLTPYSKPEALSVRSAKGTTRFKVEIADSFKETIMACCSNFRTSPSALSG